MVEHRQVGRLLAGTAEWFGFNEGDVWTMFHSYGFDFSVWELWGALAYGGRVVVVPYLVSRTPEAFLQLVAEAGVTVLNQTPSGFGQLQWAVERRAEAGEPAAELRLRVVIFGGEALAVEGLRGWVLREGLEGPELINMYGITETTVHVTYHRVEAGEVEGAGRRGGGSKIGAPIRDLQVYVLDEQQGLAPVGVRGELYVGGAGVTRGYLGQAGQTAWRYVPDELGGVAGGRLYRTGDVGRWLESGELEYLGRADHQVKVRGHRIELGEIEAALRSHGGVRAAVVMLRSEAGEEPRLVAYIEGEGEGGVSGGELREYLRSKLPEYMAPAGYVMLERLPVTENGKVDRKALAEVAAGTATREAAGEYVAPRTPIEEMLAQIWADVLRVDRVGVNDNFFALGGDSMRILQVLSRAQERGLKLSAQQIYQHQSIHLLALQVAAVKMEDDSKSDRQAFALISREDRLRLPDEIEDAYPLTKLQLGMLFHTELSPDRAIYQNISSYHLRAALDIDVLRKSAQQLVNRHPVLRTCFDLNSFSEPLQLVFRTVEAPLQVDDLRHLSSTKQAQAINDWIESEKQRSFDWQQPPLFRLHVHLRDEQSYQFTLVEHHAILDGWSVASMLTELFQLYFSSLTGAAPKAEPALATSFSDYVAEEKKVLASELTRKFWEDQVAGAIFSRLPRCPNPEPGIKEQVEIVRVPIAAEVSAGLQELAQKAETPMKSVALAAHLKVMSLVSGQRDVVTGLISNGRLEEPDGEHVLGLFLNTLPFRMNHSSGSWLDLVRQIFALESATMPHRRYPLSEIQKMCGGQAIFETAFNFTRFHVYQEIQEFKGVEILDAIGLAETNFTLLANFNQHLISSQLELTLHCNLAELSSQQIRALASYYIETLTSMAHAPLSECDSICLLPKTEREQILVKWNDTQTEYPGEKLLQRLFEEQVERTPNAPAVIFDDQRLSYRELNERANRLAHYLRSRGIGRETIVGVLMERSVDLVVSLYAILKAGAAYMPLEPAYPRERLRFMIQDANVSTIVTQKYLAELVTEGDEQIVCLDTDKERIARERAINPTIGVGPQNLAYVIYTSGSTGRPKGSMISHEGICNRLLWMQDAYRLDESDCVLQKTPFSFDVSVWEFFWPLLCGARLVVAKPEGHKDPSYLVRAIIEHGITTLHFVPSMLGAFLDEGGIEACSSLKRVICSGEALSTELQNRLFARLHAELHNLYGPTEASVDVTHWACLREASQPTVPIGKPIANIQMYVLDRHLQPVPVGTPGDLYIGGTGLARGYLNRPGLTAERFIPDLHSDKPGARLYRTGDLARYLSNGELEFLGRSDYQVKIRGFRIELGEVEAVLRQHPAVREAVVLARQDLDDKRLVAYVVTEKEQSTTAADLRLFLKEQLPEYLVPAALMLIDALPLTPNGKVDRRALPAPDKLSLGSKDAHIAPRDAMERRIAELWKELLGLSSVSVTDNFFDLGGHSLLALRMMARINAEFEHKLSLSTLVPKATVEQLAAVLRHQNDGKPSSPLVVIQSLGTKPPLFWVHPSGGSVLCYLPLSHQLGDEQPFYGFQDPALENGAEPFRRIDAMASHYIEALQAFQPQGPYILGGYSYGGLVAFEMAQQLHLQKEHVPLVILLDSMSPHSTANLLKLEAELGIDDSLMLALDAKEGARQMGKDLPLILANFEQLSSEQRLANVWTQIRQINLLPPEIGFDEVQRYLQLHRARREAVRNYKPRKYSGRLVLLQSSEPVPDHLDGLAEFLKADRLAKLRDTQQDVYNEPAYGWDRLALNGPEVYTVRGDHYAILSEPHVQELASVLKTLLTEA
jgi:amino acid adenylation domain-containing protein